MANVEGMKNAPKGLVGAEVVVYWGPPAGCTGGRLDESSWFRGAVRKVEQRITGDGEVLQIACIRYHRVRSFPHFHQEVVLDQSASGSALPTLRCTLTGIFLTWRLQNKRCKGRGRVAGNGHSERRSDAAGSLVGGIVIASAGDEADCEDRALREEADREHIASRVVTAAQPKESSDCKGTKSSTPRRVEGNDGALLETRVQYLEAAIMLHRDSLSQLRGGVRPEIIASHDRPLLYLRMRLNLVLQQTPRGAKVKRCVGSTSMIGDVLSCHGDCSLAEFESLCFYVLSTPKLRARIHPKCTTTDEIPHLGEDIITIEFATATDLFAVMGISANALTAKAMVKVGKDRPASSITPCRVIGHLLCRGQEAPDPMCISVGHVNTEGFYDKLPDEVPVLLREDTSWNFIDNTFENELEFTSVQKSYCRELREEYGKKEEDAAKRADKNKRKRKVVGGGPGRTPGDNHAIMLRWERCRNRNDRDVIFGPNSAHMVTGRLRAAIPVVIVNDEKVCAEIAKRCTPGRISALML